VSILFLHGLESHLGPDGEPQGRKLAFLRPRFPVRAPALDTRAAIAAAHRAVEATGTWRFPFDGYEEAFRVPLARARAALTPAVRLVIGSSFGGAVALRLLHEAPRWTGPTLLLAGAGPRLTPHRTLPAGVPVHLVHGRFDEVVPMDDSRTLAASRPGTRLTLTDDDHGLTSILTEEALGSWVREALDGSGGP
jgi:pimeloyl-ACP methyl ester carboxylesterase